MESEYQFFGKHYLASFIDCDSNSLLNIDGLKNAMINGINKSGATILSYTENGSIMEDILSYFYCQKVIVVFIHILKKMLFLLIYLLVVKIVIIDFIILLWLII